MPDLYIKDVPDDVYKKLEEIAKATGRPKKDIIIEALIIRLTGSQYSPSGELVEISEPKLTILRFPAKCARCGGVINASEEAFLAKAKYKDGERWVAWHFSCLMTDKQLSRLYVEIRKYKKIRDQLKKEADELADLVNDAEARKKILDAVSQIQHQINDQLVLSIEKTLSMLREYMASVEANTDLKKIAEELSKIDEKIQQIEQDLDELKQNVMLITPAKSRRKVQAYEGI
jgi:DNA repair exonuclease SbcCD ATPase subunit